MYVECYRVLTDDGHILTGSAEDLAKHLGYNLQYIRRALHLYLIGEYTPLLTEVTVLPGYTYQTFYRSERRLPNGDWYTRREVSVLLGSYGPADDGLIKKRRRVPYESAECRELLPVIRYSELYGKRYIATLPELKTAGLARAAVLALHGIPGSPVRDAELTGMKKGQTLIYSRNGKTWYSAAGGSLKWQCTRNMVLRNRQLKRRKANVLLDDRGKVIAEYEI